MIDKDERLKMNEYSFYNQDFTRISLFMKHIKNKSSFSYGFFANLLDSCIIFLKKQKFDFDPNPNSRYLYLSLIK